MPSNDVLDDEARLRARLSSLATSMDLAPELTGEAGVPRTIDGHRPRRGVAILSAAAVIALVVAAFAALGPLSGGDGVEVSTADATAPATVDQASGSPLGAPIPSEGFFLSEEGQWQPGAQDGPRSTPEEAVRSYLTATMGAATVVSTTFSTGPVVQVDGVTTISATLPSGEELTMTAAPEPGGTWLADSMTIGNTRKSSAALPGDGPDTAVDLELPVVEGATQGRLWYRSDDVTWQMELGNDVMATIESATPGVQGDEDSIRALVPATNGVIQGLVLVYIDGQGNPITVHSIGGLSFTPPS